MQCPGAQASPPANNIYNTYNIYNNYSNYNTYNYYSNYNYYSIYSIYTIYNLHPSSPLNSPITMFYNTKRNFPNFLSCIFQEKAVSLLLF